MKKFRCPKCGSTAVWERVSVLAKYRINSPNSLPYDVQKNVVDNQFEGDCGCSKCDWEGTFDELIWGKRKAT